MKYCLQCGKPNEPTANFCCKCGGSFVSLDYSKASKTTLPPKIRPPNPAPRHDPDDDDDTDDSSVSIPEISQLDVEITPTKIRKETIGGLYGTSSRAPRPQEKAKKINKKAILDEFRRESSAIKPK